MSAKEPINEYDSVTVGLISRITSTAERVLGRNLAQGADPAVADALVILANDHSIKQLLQLAKEAKSRAAATALDDLSADAASERLTG